MKKSRKVLSSTMTAAMLAAGVVSNVTAESAVTVLDETAYDTVANVEGKFSFSQDVVSPSDDVFNIFGTAVTGACAKPAFVTENSKADYLINISGKLTKAYSVNLTDLKNAEENDLMLCACATGVAAANAAITGISLKNVISMADIAADVNTISVIGSDGYKVSLPLRYALDQNAMIVYGVNGEAIPSGTQLWVPNTVAHYFVRDVVDLVLTAEESEPALIERDAELRAQVSFMNYMTDTFKAGTEIIFEGYADDLGSPITSVEFSLDNGATWTSYETADATTDKWVYWNFTYAAETAGTYKLDVRATTADGIVSPLTSSVVFTVQ